METMGLDVRMWTDRTKVDKWDRSVSRQGTGFVESEFVWQGRSVLSRVDYKGNLVQRVPLPGGTVTYRFNLATDQFTQTIEIDAGEGKLLRAV